MARITNWWNNYWFSPSSSFNLAVTRILAAALWLLWMPLINPPEKINNLHGIADLYDPLPILSLLTLGMSKPSQEVTTIIYIVMMIAGILALIGLRTNISMMVLALSGIFLQTFIYSFGDFHHPTALFLIAMVLLAISPSGEVLSVDYWLKRRHAARQGENPSNVWDDMLTRKNIYAGWPLRTIQWLLALAYMSAFISKVLTPDLQFFSWANGFTLQYYMLSDGLLHDVPLALELSRQHTLAVLLSWGSLLFEGAFFLAVFIPWTRWLFIPFGIAFHGSIFLIQRAPFFTFMVLYSAFVPWDKFALWLRARAGSSQPIIPQAVPAVE